MRSHPLLAAISLLCLSLTGCAALFGSPCDSALRDPERLIELADRAVEQGDLELAYRYAGSIHALHPKSPQDHEVFPLAARLFRHHYKRNRTELDSIWVTSEPRFMVGWLAGFFQDGGEFPQEQMDMLFIGLDYGLFRHFLAYAEGHPRLSRWTITADDDNGIVHKIRGAPAS